MRKFQKTIVLDQHCFAASEGLHCAKQQLIQNLIAPMEYKPVVNNCFGSSSFSDETNDLLPVSYSIRETE